LPRCVGARASREPVLHWSKEFLEAGKQRLAGDTARQATAPEVKELRAEAAALKEVVADLTLENRLLKKSMIGDGEDERMRYPASEKLEIIRTVEASHLPVKRRWPCSASPAAPITLV
jgi:putative transposase